LVFTKARWFGVFLSESATISLTSMHALENGNTRVVINPLGAELHQLEVAGIERLWQGDPAYWARRSPVLFPVVGKCKNNQLIIDGMPCAMAQHGFARDLPFEPFNIKTNSIEFRLFDNGDTLLNYPFAFELSIVYTILKSGVHVRYHVFNPGNRALPFALGAHPAFQLPKSGFDRIYLAFSEEESFERHLLDQGLFTGETKPLGFGKQLELSKELFDLDAVVLKNIHSKKVKLSGPESFHMEMQFDGFCDFGLWTKANCDKFICLEPWYGHADSTLSPKDKLRSGLHLLEPGCGFEAFWQVEF
jgi:galactose mutarotase-like enzyme